MKNMPKFVVSTTLKNAQWHNTTIIRKNIMAEIKKLKKQKGKNILVAGSGTLVHSLLQHNLIDELRLMVEKQNDYFQRRLRPIN